MSLKKWTTVFMTLTAVFMASADFIDEFRAAEKLFQSGKFKAAVSAFEKLEKESPKNAHDNCLRFLSHSLVRTGKYQEAINTAEKIADPNMRNYSKLFAMYHFGSQRKKISTQFPGDCFETWGDFKCSAYLLRGLAQNNSADLEKAGAMSGGDSNIGIIAYSTLAGIYSKESNKTKAFEAATKALSYNWNGRFYHIKAALIKAKILIENKQYDEAKKLLDSLKMSRFAKRESGREQNELYAQIALAGNNKKLAIEYYEKALSITANPSYKERIQKQIDAIK